MKSQRIIGMLCLALLAGCGTTWVQRKPSVENRPTGSQKMKAAMQAPIRDMNLLQEEIPEVLKRALIAPYATTQPISCELLGGEILDLGAVLGADIDSDPELREKDDFAMRAFVSGIHGLMPYRSWLRKLSGAEKRELRAIAAIAAGGIRRGYLKGLGEARGCAPPATPNRGPSETTWSAQTSAEQN